MLDEVSQFALNVIDNPLAVKDRFGQVVRCNRAFLELLELEEGNVLGRSVFEYLSCDEAKFHDLADKKSLALGGDGHIYKATLERSTPKMLEIYKAPLINRPKLGCGLLVIVKRLEAKGVGGLDRQLALTPREKVVMEHLLRGGSQKRIALDLGISPHTVNDHLKKIYIKLGAKSRSEALYLALNWLGSDGKKSYID